jgi:ribosomal protein L11 methyltransferase
MKDRSRRSARNRITADYSVLLVEVRPNRVDEVSAALFDAGASGVETRDEIASGLTLEYAATPGAVLLVGYFEAGRAQAAHPELARAFPPRVLLRCEARAGERVDWVERFREHFKPLAIGRSFLVVPPWLSPRSAEVRRVAPDARRRHCLIIDPGPAFGTGQHATTTLCLEALELLARYGRLSGRVLDVGAGSGILAMGAVLLGARSALGIENDPVAVAWGRRTVKQNALGRQVHLSGRVISALRGQFPVIVANIRTAVLLELMPAIVPRLCADGTLILSGIMAPEAADMVAGVIRSGLRVEQQRAKGEWVALVARAPR